MKLFPLISELRRRRIFRGAGLYIVGVWLVLQVADVISEPLGLPGWTLSGIIYLAIIGFPLALFLSWRYQLGEDGLIRTHPAGDGEVPAEELALTWFDYATIAALVLITAGLVYGIITTAPTLTQGEAEQSIASKSIDRNSIAVLPFADRSMSQDQEYFADGLSDTLLHVLSKVHGLKVAARTSSFSFKGRQVDAREIAATLGVAHLLEGSVQKSGNRIRVIAQLIDASSGTNLWSETFEGDLDDIFSIQDDISARVVESMQIVLLESDQARLAERYRPDIRAYDELVLGRYSMGRANVANLEAAATHFRKAIEIDPDYALPYVYLADVLSLVEVYTLGIQDSFSGISTYDTRQEQQRLIAKALELDPLSGEAFASRAAIEIDNQKAEEDFEKAIHLAPNYANAYLWYSKFLSIRQGRYEEALTQIEKAVELDPVSDIIRLEQAKMVWAVGKAEQAVQMLQDNLDRNPDFPPYYKRMARWQAQMGELGKAGIWIDALRRLEPESPSHWGEFGGECWILDLLRHPDHETCLRSFIEAFPESVTARRMRATMNEDYGSPDSTVIRLFDQLVREEPGNRYRANQYAFELQIAGQYERALEVLQNSHPQLFRKPPRVDGETTWPASIAIFSMIQLGRTNEAYQLLDEYERAINGMRIILGPGFTNGIENVEAAALRGNPDEAIRRLERAQDQGWRFIWTALPYLVTLESVRQDPRYLEIIRTFEEDAKRQRRWYDANRGVSPLTLE